MDAMDGFPAGRAARPPLVLKLALLLGVPLALFSAAALLFLTSWSRRQFLEDARRIGEEGEEEMRASSEEVLAASHGIVTGLVEKTTEANRRALAELPFELWGVDPSVERDIKEEIRRHGESLRDRSLSNAEAITREFRDRATARLERRAEGMRVRQEQASRLFARRLEGQSVAFLAASVVLLVGVLWAGLWFTVLRPIRRIRAGTERLGTGDLSFRIESASGDELGGLAGSFNRMAGDLSRTLRDLAEEQKALERANREILDWNRSLEERVREKTAALETSLEALRKAQSELIHSAKMAGIGTLAGGIAHEFNNMLGGIRGCAEDALEEKDPAAVKEALEVILKTSHRACAVVDDLLRFARKTPSLVARFPLAEAASDTLRLLEGEFQRNGIRVEALLDGGAEVSGDPSRLQQVFLNLLTNAVHALDASPVKTLRVSVRRDGPFVVAEVSDSGPGIPVELADRVFEPFFTTKDGRGPKGRMGTGLGLSVTYGILEAHGGAVEARPTGDLGGATFTFRMPAADGREGPDSGKPPGSPAGGPAT